VQFLSEFNFDLFVALTLTYFYVLFVTYCTLPSLSIGTENGVTVAVGDSLLGDCKRDACAEAVIQCLKNVECKNLVFSIVSNEEKALTDDQWTGAFVSMCS